MKLKKIKSVGMAPRAPFDFDTTFHKASHFASNDNYWQTGTYWQTFYWQGKQLGLRFDNLGTVSNPKIRLNIYYTKTLDKQFINSLVNEIRYRFDFDVDLKEFYRIFKNDKVLGPVIKRMKGSRAGHASSLYEYLIIAIVLQNTFVKRSVQMLQALFENYVKLLEYDKKKLWCFWKPGGLIKVKEQDLRDLKIGYRAKSIKKIDEQFAKGLVNELELRKKDKETQKKELLKLYGIGPATVWYLLVGIFHHYDFFDYISPWEQKIYSKLFFNKNPEKPVSVKKLLKYFEKYGRYKQLAVHYIWEDLWWKRKNKHIPWLEKLIRI